MAVIAAAAVSMHRVNVTAEQAVMGLNIERHLA
jgi:hypothetical protein